MTLKIKRGIIYIVEEGYQDNPVGSVFDHVSPEVERVIECGSEILPKVEEFISRVNSGSFKPKSEVNEFQSILDKYEL